MSWNAIKDVVEHWGIATDALHVLVGLVLQIAFSAVTRVPVRSWLPWTIVLLLELANEYSDLQAEIWPDRWAQYHESGKDLLLTMALPTLLLLVSRFAPRLLVGGPRRSKRPAPDAAVERERAPDALQIGDEAAGPHQGAD